jgi:hypothetical protein
MQSNKVAIMLESVVLWNSYIDLGNNTLHPIGKYKM